MFYYPCRALSAVRVWRPRQLDDSATCRTEMFGPGWVRDCANVHGKGIGIRHSRIASIATPSLAFIDL